MKTDLDEILSNFMLRLCVFCKDPEWTQDKADEYDKEALTQAITAIEKWAKEKYGKD